MIDQQRDTANAKRSLSAEIRSAMSWMTCIIAPVGWTFGLLNGRQAVAAVVAAALIGLSTVQPKGRPPTT